MITDLLTTLGGLLVGILTGFYFERRANRATEAQNTDLRHELDVLRATVYSLGGDPDSRPAPQSPTDLAAAVHARALVTQDASGRVRRRELIAHFLEHGIDVRDVEEALTQLCLTGAVKEEGRWLQIH